MGLPDCPQTERGFESRCGVPAALRFAAITDAADAAAPACHRSPSAVWDAPAPLRYWHLGSFDAPTVAACWAWGLAWAAHAAVPPWALLLLSLVVWVIYVLDRLIDVCTALPDQLRERHFFHWRHRRLLLAMAALASAIAGWIVAVRLPRFALRPDSLVAAGTLAYMFSVHFRRRSSLLTSNPSESKHLERSRSRYTRFCNCRDGFSLMKSRSAPEASENSNFETARTDGSTRFRVFSKGTMAATLFAAGCALPALTQLLTTNRAFPWALLAPAGFFCALARLNLYAIKQWESDRPARGHKVSLAAGGLALAGACVAALLGETQACSAALLGMGALSAVLIAALDGMRGRMTKLTLRAAADFVLLTPLLLAVGRLPWR